MQGFDIDYIPVGKSSKGGDAIIIRYGNLKQDPIEQKIIVIDGGNKESGNQVVEHIKNYYRTTTVDLAILTHPDMDHASGLIEVVKGLDVKELWMHRPWIQKDIHADLFEDGRLTDNSVNKRLTEAFKYAYNLDLVAQEKNVKIKEPKTGDIFDNQLEILGPDRSFYIDCLLNSDKTPTAIETVQLEGVRSINEKDEVEWIEENLENELFDDNDEPTSPINNTSIILLAKLENYNILFTGDAGRSALNEVLDNYPHYASTFNSLDLLHVPHHGSRKNLNPDLLDKIKAKYAVISVPLKGAPKHPSYKLINALIRRGAEVYTTAGQSIHWGVNTEERNWGVAFKETFKHKVEK